MKAFVIISDYRNRLEAGYPRQDGITEIEIKTTLDDIVQAKAVNNHAYETVTDIRRKSILEIPLKTSGLAS